MNIDVVEQLADKIEYLEKQMDSIRRERDHTPIKMVNKIPPENMKSSMTPNTHLLSDMANRRTNISIDDEIGRSTDEPIRRNKNKDQTIKNLSYELTDNITSPNTDKVRESYMIKSRLARHLVDDHNPRKRDFIEIDKDRVHKDDVPYKLRTNNNEGRQTPEKCMHFLLITSNHINHIANINKMRQDSFMPANYKLNAKEEAKYPAKKPSANKDHHPTKRRTGSNVSKNSRNSKYSYDKKKNVVKNIDYVHKGTDLDKPKNIISKPANDLIVQDFNDLDDDDDDDDESMEEDYQEELPYKHVQVNQSNKLQRKENIGRR